MRRIDMLVVKLLTGDSDRVTAHANATEDVRKFKKSVHHFAGSGYSVPLRISGAVWIGTYADNVAERIRNKCMNLAALLYVSTAVAMSIRDPGWREILEPISAPGVPDGIVPPGPLEALAYGIFLWYLFLRVGQSAAGAPLTIRRSKRRLAHVNRLPYLCAIVIRCCAYVHKKGLHQTRRDIKDVDLALGLLIRELQKLPGDRDLFARRSPRRSAVRHHVNLVVAALQKQSLRLDTAPLDAAQELASMAMRICDAYVKRTWGQLLLEVELVGLEEARNREAIRMAVAGIVTLSVSYLGAVFGVPGAVLPLVFGFVGMISFNVILGRSPRSLELLDSMRGIQRP